MFTVRKVKAQPVGSDERALLVDVVPKDLLRTVGVKCLFILLQLILDSTCRPDAPVIHTLFQKSVHSESVRKSVHRENTLLLQRRKYV